MHAIDDRFAPTVRLVVLMLSEAVEKKTRTLSIFPEEERARILHDGKDRAAPPRRLLPSLWFPLRQLAQAARETGKF